MGPISRPEALVRASPRGFQPEAGDDGQRVFAPEWQQRLRSEFPSSGSFTRVGGGGGFVWPVVSTPCPRKNEFNTRPEPIPRSHKPLCGTEVPGRPKNRCTNREHSSRTS